MDKAPEDIKGLVIDGYRVKGGNSLHKAKVAIAFARVRGSVGGTECVNNNGTLGEWATVAKVGSYFDDGKCEPPRIDS